MENKQAYDDLLSEIDMRLALIEDMAHDQLGDEVTELRGFLSSKVKELGKQQNHVSDAGSMVSPVEWLAGMLEYVTWLRNRDEITAGSADNLRKHYLDQAKQMQSDLLLKFWNGGIACTEEGGKSFDQFYNQTFKTKNDE